MNPRDKLICTLEFLEKWQLQVSAILIKIRRALPRKQSQHFAVVVEFEAFLARFMPSYQDFNVQLSQDPFCDIFAEKFSRAPRRMQNLLNCVIWVAPQQVFEISLFRMSYVCVGQVLDAVNVR